MVDLLERFGVVVQICVSHTRFLNRAILLVPIEQLLCLEQVVEHVFDGVRALLAAALRVAPVAPIAV